MARSKTNYATAVNARGRLFIKFKWARRFVLLDYVLKEIHYYGYLSRVIRTNETLVRKHRYYVDKFNKYKFWFMKKKRYDGS